MGAAMSRARGYDAAASPGYEPSKLTDERINHMKKCAERAQTTFPDTFIKWDKKSSLDMPQETELSANVLERGRWAN